MLPFTADVLFSNFAQYNRALWPLPILAWVLALAAILLTLRPVWSGDRVITGLLAAGWLWTGYGYHYLQFATINFAAPVYAVFFVLQGLLIAWSGGAKRGLAFRFRPDPAGWTGLGLALAAAVAWPLAAPLAGYGWESARLVGLAPGPTAVFTLGLLLLTDGPTPLRLLAVPLLWTIVAGATAWALSIHQDVVQPVAALGVLGLALWKNRRLRRH